jgi:cyclopropane-fatty-acyl-phospholipid synthase
MSTQPSSHSLLRNPVAWFQPLLRTRHAWRVPAAARVVLRLLGQLQYGALDVQLPDGTTRNYGQKAGDTIDDSRVPHARVTLANWNVCAAALKSGDIGFAQTYLDGDWHTDDLAALLDIMVRNRTTIEALIYGSWLGKLTNRFRHLRNANTREGSRRNIHAHYDLGNAFYKLWLDDTMTYSSALFDGTPEQSLADAQRAKYRRLLNELAIDGVEPHVLEIGCGWGGFAELAASEAKAHVTGLTLSTEQLAFAQQRMTDAGLGPQADLRLQDYRDIHGQFDAIASIEMFEAVGEAFWPGYFECIRRNLKRGGRACVQTITVDQALFERYRTSTDFIQQYIFPGGMLPSPAVFVQSARRHGLKVINQLSFGRDYARTLQLWRGAFTARLDEIRAQQFDDRFIRLWDFYLCYCEAAFAHSNTDVIQFTLEHA